MFKESLFREIMKCYLKTLIIFRFSISETYFIFNFFVDGEFQELSFKTTFSFEYWCSFERYLTDIQSSIMQYQNIFMEN